MKKLLAAFLLLISSAIHAEAEQAKILVFNSSMIVNQDTSIDVTENISVYTNQNLPGITRQFLTDFKNNMGVTQHNEFSIKQVVVNDTPTKYTTNTEGNQFTIYVGDKDATLAPGLYVYTLQYHVNNAVNFFQGVYQLYWNITGYAWQLPIYKVDADITLPDGSTIVQYSGYMGKMGEQRKGFYATQAKNKVTFSTTQPLLPSEGLAVAITWQKGSVTSQVNEKPAQTVSQRGWPRFKAALLAAIPAVRNLISP